MRIKKIETGSVKISKERLMQIASVLDKPIASFLADGKAEKQEVKISVNENEWNLTQKIILQQEIRIKNLEEQLLARDEMVIELKDTVENYNASKP